MNFIPADTTMDLFLRRVSEDGVYEMGFSRVMFGYRVQLGRVGDIGLALDWCAGDIYAHMKWLYWAMLECMKNTDLENLPTCSDPKPFYNDFKFMKVVVAYAKPNVNQTFDLFTVDDFEREEKIAKHLFLTHCNGPETPEEQETGIAKA